MGAVTTAPIFNSEIMKIIASVILAFSPFIVNAQLLKGRVISVHDGDTFTMIMGDSTKIRVRLHAIDCPELKQEYGDSAQVFTSKQILDKEVEVKKTASDKYGRIVGMVYVDSFTLNEELLKAGLAWHYLKYDKTPRLDSLQSTAKQQKMGLWRLLKPIEPWNYRHL